MSSCNKCGSFACACSGVQISLLVGGVIALLFYFGNFPLVAIAAIISLVVAGISLLTLVLSSLFAAATSSSALKKCCCNNGLCLLAGIIGSAITALAILTSPVAPVVVGYAILVGIAAFFFAFTAITLTLFIRCIICSLCVR